MKTADWQGEASSEKRCRKQHIKGETLFPMKTFAIVAGLTALLSAGAAQAIQVTHVEDSVTRTWFTVMWGAAPSAPLAHIENGPLSDAGAVDDTTSIQVDYIHPFAMDTFDINFAVGSRLFSTATVAGFAGTQILPLAGEVYGVQVVYGEAVPVNGVPDAGATAALLILAGIGLAVGRQRVS